MMLRFWEGIIKIIFPYYCLICNKKIDNEKSIPLCIECFDKIHWNLPPFCTKCGRSMPIELSPLNLCLECKKKRYYFDRAWSASYYEGIMLECIHRFKYQQKFSLIDFFKNILCNFIEKYLEIEKFNYLLPIPLHSTKLRERGFNQAFLLTQPIAKQFKKKILENVWRKKPTLSQTELNAKQRRENIKGAFAVKNPILIKGKNILIIDDVFTTGSTVNECALVLKKNGARIVEVLTIAC